MMRLVSLSRGLFAKVDDDDYEWLNNHTWFAVGRDGYAYAARHDGKRQILMHREILGLSKGQRGDHRDRDVLNNQRYNLRVATAMQNAQNKGKCRVETSSRYKGVCYIKDRRLWQANIRVDGTKRYLGHFRDEVAAAIAYNIAACQAFGAFAAVNRITLLP